MCSVKASVEQSYLSVRRSATVRRQQRNGAAHIKPGRQRILHAYVGLASSGGIVPLQALPGALRWLAEIEPLRQILAGTRRSSTLWTRCHQAFGRGSSCSWMLLVAGSPSIWVITSLARILQRPRPPVQSRAPPVSATGVGFANAGFTHHGPIRATKHPHGPRKAHLA